MGVTVQNLKTKNNLLPRNKPRNKFKSEIIGRINCRCKLSDIT